MGSGSPDISRAARVPTNPSTAATPAAPATTPPATSTPPAAPAGIAGDTFRRLSPSVSAGQMAETDAKMLADQAARPGVISEPQAIRAARVAAALPDGDRARFQAAVDGAGSDTQKAFIYKALAAGHPVNEVVDFAGQIHGLADQQLLKDYTLSGPLANKDAPGLGQQFSTSCVPSVAETLRGDADPIYAKSVRTQNEDVNLNAPDVKNAPLRGAEKQLLEGTGGGKAVPFDAKGNAPGGQPTQPNKVDDVLNSVSRYTGVTYRQAELPRSDALHASDGQMALLDQLGAQLQQGIATPFQVRTPDNQRAHEALAIAVEGTGAQQRFLVHDPASGDTAWLSRKDLVWGANAFPEWGGFKYGLSGVALAEAR